MQYLLTNQQKIKMIVCGAKNCMVSPIFALKGCPTGSNYIRTTSINGVWGNHPPQIWKRLVAASKRATLNHLITNIFLPFFLSYYPRQIIWTPQQPIYHTCINPMHRRHSSVVSPYHHLSKVISPYHHFTIFLSHHFIILLIYSAIPPPRLRWS